ncbi:Dabb family protein [Spirillospora sp. NBC_01491]|uniref:Dabb family protein n=1 Tax=Spirillospora sp. NBC_01491 TaxID=2976007 RepID=UPI002E374553|nr:Dabb family protein [Spirillospora sp. NBC_01491]
MHRHRQSNALEHLRRMGREIEAVQSFCVGRDVGAEFDYGAMFAVKDIEGYRAYMHAPIHRETDSVGLPILDKMISQDLTDDEDPAIGAQIQEIHRTRYANDPELVALVDGLDSYTGSGRPSA